MKTRVQAHLRLCSEFEASMGHMRLCLKQSRLQCNPEGRRCCMVTEPCSAAARLEPASIHITAFPSQARSRDGDFWQAQLQLRTCP